MPKTDELFFRKTINLIVGGLIILLIVLHQFLIVAFGAKNLRETSYTRGKIMSKHRYVSDYFGNNNLVLAINRDGDAFCPGKVIDTNMEDYLHFKRDDVLAFLLKLGGLSRNV